MMMQGAATKVESPVETIWRMIMSVSNFRPPNLG